MNPAAVWGCNIKTKRIHIKTQHMLFLLELSMHCCKTHFFRIIQELARSNIIKFININIITKDMLYLYINRIIYIHYIEISCILFGMSHIYL